MAKTPAFLLLTVVGAAANFVGACARDAAPPPRVAQVAAGAATGPAVALDPGRGRLAIVGDLRLEEDTAVACFAEAAGDLGGAKAVRLELTPDDPAAPRAVVVVPEDGEGAAEGSFALRLPTEDGTFTESVGSARVALERRAAEAGRELSGTFAAHYSGAAGEGEATGAFGPCRP